MTAFGATVALLMLLTGHKPRVFAGRYIYFKFNRLSGFGFEGGPFFFVAQDAEYLELMQHEAGHGLQNIILGPLMPLLVSVPSAARYWYREWCHKYRPEKPLPPYDAVWFEGWATRLGKRHYPNG